MSAKEFADKINLSNIQTSQINAMTGNNSILLECIQESISKAR